MIDLSFGEDMNPSLFVEFLHGKVHTFLEYTLTSHTRNTLSEGKETEMQSDNWQHLDTRTPMGGLYLWLDKLILQLICADHARLKIMHSRSMRLLREAYVVGG